MPDRADQLFRSGFRMLECGEIHPEHILKNSTAQANAEIIGLKALTFLVRTPETLDRFLALSGTDGESLRRRASEPDLLAAVLEFLLGNEGLLTQFCDQESVDARAVHLAAARLGM